MVRRASIWLPVATVVGAATVISIAFLAGGRLDETDGRVIVSGVAALACGGAALAALVLIERRQLSVLASLVLAGSLVEFVVMELAIWTFVDEQANRYMRWGWTAVVWLLPTLVVPATRLLLREPRLVRWGVPFVFVSLVAFAGVFTEIIWTTGDHDGPGRITAVLGFLGGGAFLALPAVERTRKVEGQTARAV